MERLELDGCGCEVRRVTNQTTRAMSMCVARVNNIWTINKRNVYMIISQPSLQPQLCSLSLYFGTTWKNAFLQSIIKPQPIKQMQKWQEKQRQRAHHYMIEQAKPTIKRYSRSRERPNLSSSRSNSNNINMPFRQVLSVLQLQRYESLLLSYGFPERIKEKQSMSCIDQLMGKVEQQDQERLYSLMSVLLSVTAEPKNSFKKTPLRKTVNKNLPPTSTSSNLKKSDSLLNRNNCESLSSKKNEKNTHFRIKSKTHIQRETFHSPPPISTFTEKTIKKQSKARDDISIIHEINIRGVRTVKDIGKANSLLGRIQERLKKIGGEDKNDAYKEAKLYYNQIKEMYLSYDSATLTSNIANIDLQQIIECYAIQIQSHLRSPRLNPEKREKTNKYHIQHLLKKSLIKVQPNLTENSYLDDDVNETISVGSDDGSEGDLQGSSDMFDFQKQSTAVDLSCFNYPYQDEAGGACGRKDIKNFIQLVMMAGKMEKEVPILSYAYVLRLLNRCGKDQLNWRNWKSLTLVTLIEASKIWDDQSLQNHSFAKVLQPYTTLQINRLQRHLLGFLNYHLQVQPKQYCESYFRLRRHAPSACKTAHLMRLSLQTIRKLQSGTKKCEKNLMQAYRKRSNKSF